MIRHVNIPIFIPHLGCPNTCVFCNQKKITGVDAFDIGSVSSAIEASLATVSSDADVEIAFFGGSFTGIDFNLMTELLKIAYGYVKNGKVQSIRCSTRPDYIDERILQTLKLYGVKTIELGLQSSDNEVLAMSKRGHSFEDEIRAVRLIKEYGFSLVGQMMIGLPGSTLEKELETARFIISCGADAARIYPTVVFKETELCEMAILGTYQPISLEDGVVRSAEVASLFYENGVEVIRIGLCASENLSAESSYFAGPNHSALGELVENRIFYNIIKKKAENLNIDNSGSIILVKVPKGSLSKAIGQKKINKIRLESEFLHNKFEFTEDDGIFGYSVICERKEKKCI